jgi:hypothetical protein
MNDVANADIADQLVTCTVPDEVGHLIIPPQMFQPFLEAVRAICRVDPRMMKVSTRQNCVHIRIAIFG